MMQQQYHYRQIIQQQYYSKEKKKKSNVYERVLRGAKLTAINTDGASLKEI